ncbi:MAG: hypothetical protein P8Y63_08340 [Deltaproteobacteria bacterium]
MPFFIRFRSSGLARLDLCSCLLLAILGVGLWAPVSVQAVGQAEKLDAAESWLARNAEWGGYLKVQGAASWPAADSLLGAGETETLGDWNLEGRLNNTLFFGSRTNLETNYEAVWVGGDSRRRLGGAEQAPAVYFVGSVPDDDRRLFDLTQIIREDQESVFYQRLDRLVLTRTFDWGEIRAGRQAVTWGHGLLFNPMDLFNPFAPTDIQREYKLGDDLLYVQISKLKSGDLQMLYVPRRDPDTGEVEWDQSSLAGKVHFARGVTEFDLMAAKHIECDVFGLGSVGYIGTAAWRFDAVWTHPNEGDSASDYLSLVSNLDTSWVWWGKNFYGFIEFFYSGIGKVKGDYTAALLDPEITDRLARGELFTVGRFYLDGMVQVELHPLVNLFLTMITNVQDPSGIVLPRLVWDVTENTQLLVGASIPFGAFGTELGGFPLPGSSLTTRPPAAVFLWASYYF